MDLLSEEHQVLNLEDLVEVHLVIIHLLELEIELLELLHRFQHKETMEVMVHLDLVVVVVVDLVVLAEIVEQHLMLPVQVDLER